MLSIPGVGEAMFSITSSPTLTRVSGVFYQKVRLSDRAGFIRWSRASRSPFAGLTATASRSKTDLKGKDLLFIAGGIGLAPLHSVINYVLRQPRADYGTVDVVYGSRSADDLVDLEEISRMPG